MDCFSGHLMSSASDQKLFCGACSAFKCSFDEFVGEKVVSLSYSSAILAPPQNLLIGKDPDAGQDWKQEEKGMTEDEMVGWHHQLNGHDFEQALGVGSWAGKPWHAAVHGVTKSWTQLNNWTEEMEWGDSVESFIGVWVTECVLGAVCWAQTTQDYKAEYDIAWLQEI